MSDRDQIISARVHAGATYLDSKYPNWHREIDTETLQLEVCDECILGQLYFDYFDFFKAEFPRNTGESKEEWHRRTYPFSFSRGFCGMENTTGMDINTFYAMNCEYFAALKQYWISAIRLRLDK